MSLVEILVALTLGALILAGVVEVYLSVKTTYRLQGILARMQENGRIASFILTKNIQMAGYTGCKRNYLAVAVKGYTSSNLPSYLRRKAINGSDVVVVRKADIGVTSLTQDIKPPTNLIRVINNPATKSQSAILVSDCKKARLLTARSFSSKTIKVAQTIHHNYHKLDSEVARFTKIAYFIGRTTRKNAAGNYIYALYSITNQSRRQELVAGIKKMQILYGVDSSSDGKVDSYYPAKQVTAWPKVLSVMITLYLAVGNNQVKKWPLYIALKERVG